MAYWLGEAYQTISFQLLLVPIALIVTRKPQRAYAMMSGYGIICVLASFIAVFYPALGTYAYYGLGYEDVANIYPYFALAPIKAFEAVREQAVYTLTLSSASGLVCFPSVHAGVAYLSTWAVWDNKWLRYPVLLLNIAMTISAISHANHYLVDIIAGFGVAAFATSIVTALFYERSGWKFRIARRSNRWERIGAAAKDVVLTTPRGE